MRQGSIDMENSSSKRKTSQPRCSICNKFLDKENPESWAFRYIDFNNINTGNPTYIHFHCWNDLEFPGRQKLVDSAASKGTLPMDSMYANLKDIHNKTIRDLESIKRILNEYKLTIEKLEFITRWHKYPNEIPNTQYEDSFWVTTIDGYDITRDVYVDGKWHYNNGKVIAWAYILVPSPFNDLCYPKKINYYKQIED